MRELLRTRNALVLGVLLAAAIIPASTRAVRAHGVPLMLQKTAGPSRDIQGGAPGVTKATAGVAERGDLTKPTVQRHPTELHLQRAGSSVFDVRRLKSTVIKRERPEHPTPGISEANEQPAHLAPSVMKHAAIATPAPAPDSSFDGLDFANWGQGHPPDTNGDVGPNYYIQTINVSIGIYDKSSGNRVAAFTFNSFMSQGHFGNLCDTANFGDPVVLYDSFEDRWFISDFAFTLDGSGNVNPQHAFQCFAVSKTGDPVNGGWNFYSIEAPGGLGDYPKFGVWPDGIYMSANLFGYAAGGSFIAPHVWALNKQQMYNGDPTPQVVDFAAPSADFTVIPANARLQTGTPPAGTPEYFTSTEEFLNGQTVYKFHVDWDKISTSTFTGPDVPIAPTCWPAVTPANASTPANAADVLAIRAMAQTQYTNIGGAESLWVDHTVDRGEIPTASCGATTAANAATRWYQINVTGGTVAANDVQAKTYDPDGNNTFFRFMPALAVDRVGDMAVGYTKSNSTTNPQIKYAGRLATDPVNTFSQDEQTLINGTGAQQGNCGSSACVRWGDYSGMALDPNGCEFWETGEYFATTGLNHQTRIGSFHFPSCTTVGNGTLSGTVTDGTNPVQGATVSLGNRTATTNASGAYSFTVPAGTYPTETAAKPGFDPASAATLVVPNGGTLTKNFTLNAAAQSGCFTDNTQSTFQRGAPSGCDLTSSPGSVQLKKNVAINQANSTTTNSGFGVNSTAWAGQTFTPSVTGQVTQVDLDLFCSGCTGTTPNVTVSIRATTGATPLPTGADLASATIPGFSTGSGGYFSAVFASPPTLTAGTRYAIVFRAASNPSAGTYAYVCSCAGTGTVDSNPYTSGQRVTSSNSGGTWAADTTVGGRDLGFNVWMNQGFATSGTFVSSLKDANPSAGRTPTWTTLSFTATTPASTAVKFQVAGSNSAAGPFTYVGPDGTANTFFTSSGASLSQFNGMRYLRYKASLSTTNTSVTPTLSSVAVCFSDTAATTPTTLTVAPATGTFGGTASLSATLTAASVGVSGETIAFTLNGTSVGTAVTNASGVATLPNASLAGINAGSYPAGVAASFAGDATNDPSSGTAALTVSKADQAITVTTHAPSTAAFNASFTVAATGGGSGNAVTFSNSGVCSNTGGTFTMTSGTGTCTVLYDQAGTANYNPAPQVSESVTAQKANQAITVLVHAPSTAKFNDSFGVSASGGGSANPVTFSSGGVCSNTGATFTMTSGTGTCSVKYDEAGDANYNAAPQVVESVTATKADQAITVTTHAPSTAVFNTSFTVAATGGASGNPVTFSSSGACSNTGGTFTMTSGTGTCTVQYDQAGDANYNAAPQVTESVTAQKAAQAISVTQHAPATAVFGTNFSVAAVGGASGNLVTFSNGGVCSNTAGTFTMTSGTGTCTVKYDQAGDANYSAAPQVTESVTAQKAGQSISVTTHAPSTAVFNTSFTVAATGGGSGNPVTFSNGGVCSNTGATFTMTSGTGTCTVQYDQAGDANYTAASQVTESVTAQKAGQTITFGPLANHSAGDPDFTVSATASSGLTVSFAASGPCTVSGTTVHITGSGSCTITASQPGNGNYNAAADVPQTFTIGGQSQTITFGALADRAYNSGDFTVSATASSGLTVSFTATGQCTVSGTTVHLVKYGTCTLTASQAGDSNWTPAPNVIQSFSITDPVPPVTTASYNPPSVTLTADDGAGGSGVAHTDYSLDSGPWTTYSGPISGFSTGGHVIQYRSTDVAGNVEATKSLSFTVAAAGAPSVTITAPNDGDSFPLGKPTTAKFKCVDKTSGIASCVGTQSSGTNPLDSGSTPLDTSTLGVHTVTVTATNNAGNTTTKVVHYSVVYTWQGFFSPIGNEADQSLNVVHAGDLIRLGFGLNGDRGTDIFAAGFPSSEPVSCPSWTPHTVPGAGPGATTGLSFGNASGHYTYGWQTSASWTNTCRRFSLKLNDGTSTVHSAIFMFFS